MTGFTMSHLRHNIFIDCSEIELITSIMYLYMKMHMYWNTCLYTYMYVNIYTVETYLDKADTATTEFSFEILLYRIAEVPDSNAIFCHVFFSYLFCFPILS